MADETSVAATTEQDEPKAEPGVLIGVEWYKSGKLNLSDEAITAVKDLLKHLVGRDMAARREQVVFIWKKRLFNRGFQHLLPSREGGWQFPPVGSGYNPRDEEQRSMFTTNIYTPYGETVTSALTRDCPKTRFRAMDYDNDQDITAGQGAEKLKPRIVAALKDDTCLEDMGNLLWTDGLTVFFTRYMLDGQRFGYAPLPEAAVPEDEEAISEGEESEAANATETDGEGVSADEGEPSGEDGAEREGGAGDREGDKGEDEEEDEEEGGYDGIPAGSKPRGAEVITAEGALEWKLPIKIKSLAQAGYARRAEELPVELAKAKYPEVATAIRPTGAGVGGDDIDRLARINVNLGVMDNYNTTDSQVFDVTEEKWFIRPATLLDLGEGAPRDELLKAAGKKGLYLTFCGDTYCEGYARSMDDHLTLLHARSGDGVNRPGLGDWLVPIQEVLNNWMELSDDYLIRGVPSKWMDNEMFNVPALRDQVNTPGATYPFDREPNVQMTEVIFEETPLVFPEALSGFIEMFQGPLAQLLCGGYPALSGAGDASATDTYGGMMVQRDAALGRLGIPWKRIKRALANVTCQGVRMLAENHEGSVTIVGSEAVTIEMEQLKGNFYAVPETDSNFPESWTEIQNRMIKLWGDAATNQMVADFVYNPDNLELFKQAFGVADLYLPQIEAREKQLGEAVILLKSAPVPNPAIGEVQRQIVEVTAKMQLSTGKNAQILASGDQNAAQQLVTEQQGIKTQFAALQQQIQQLQTAQPLVSSVDVDPEVDDSATEMAVAWKILTSPRGRELKHGTKRERAGFDNLRLHYLEHKAADQKNKATAQPKGKPPSVSLALKDMPPKVAAEASVAAGLPASQKDFEAQEAADAAAKHPGPGGVTVQ